MLSLGYPKINLQVAHSLAFQQLLETVKDKIGPQVTSAKQTGQSVVSGQSQSAFQVGLWNLVWIECGYKLDPCVRIVYISFWAIVFLIRFVIITG